MIPHVHIKVPGRPHGSARAFTLVEMVAVLAIALTLMTAGVSLLGGGAAESRRSAADTVAGLIDQARARALASRATVLLAIAEPGDLPAGDGRCRIGLFRLAEGADPLRPTGELVSRWQALPTGIVLLPGAVEGLPNLLDGPQVALTWQAGAKPLTVAVHALSIHPRGGLRQPDGSTPVVLRLAEAGYRAGRPMADRRAGSNVLPETRLKIGRVIARPFRME